jgi:uncharacterized membrane protein
MMREIDGDSFGERYSRRLLYGNVGLSVFLIANLCSQNPAKIAVYAVVIFLCLQLSMRKRNMEYERRRNEAIEDERDLQIQLRASHWARVVLATGVVLIAVALNIPALKERLVSGELLLSGVLLLVVIVANGVGHAVVMALHKKDRA